MNTEQLNITWIDPYYDSIEGTFRICREKTPAYIQFLQGEQENGNWLTTRKSGLAECVCVLNALYQFLNSHSKSKVQNSTKKCRDVCQIIETLPIPSQISGFIFNDIYNQKFITCMPMRTYDDLFEFLGTKKTEYLPVLTAGLNGMVYIRQIGVEAWKK
jgi:hypothetical protein